MKHRKSSRRKTQTNYIFLLGMVKEDEIINTMSEINIQKFKSEEEADFWDMFDRHCTNLGRRRRNRIGVQTRNSDKDKEGYFVNIPDEIAQSLDVHEKERTRIFILLCMQAWVKE